MAYLSKMKIAFLKLPKTEDLMTTSKIIEKMKTTSWTGSLKGIPFLSYKISHKYTCIYIYYGIPQITQKALNKVAVLTLPLPMNEIAWRILLNLCDRVLSESVLFTLRGT